MKKIKYCIVILLLILIIFRISIKLDNRKTRVYGFANLISIEDVQELTITETKWVGITNFNNKYLNYEADIKTSLLVNNIEELYSIDEKNKQIIIKPKQINIEVLDADIISTIPNTINEELRDQTIACMEDAREEIKKSKEFIKTSEENEKQILKNLVEPFANDWGFSIKWEEGELNGK